MLRLLGQLDYKRYNYDVIYKKLKIIMWYWLKRDIQISRREEKVQNIFIYKWLVEFLIKVLR